MRDGSLVDAAEHARFRMIERELQVSKLAKIQLIRRASLTCPDEVSHIVIFPASFNPPTTAHVAILGTLSEANVELLLLLDIQNPDKPGGAAVCSLIDRYMMMRLAFGEASQLSYGLSSHGLFIDKLAALDRLFPCLRKIEFAVGFDTFERIIMPGYYEAFDQAMSKLFNLAHFRVFNRHNHSANEAYDLMTEAGLSLYRSRLIPESLSIEYSSVSSTQVRSFNHKSNLSIPEEVAAYIKERELYQDRLQ